MYEVTLPRIGTSGAWRDAARAALAARVPPDEILWRFDAASPELFGGAPLPARHRPVKVSRAFIELADTVVWHSDPERFSRLYALLWRLRYEPKALSDPADPEVARLRKMEKAVRRCQHKMKAFVRFTDLRSAGPRRSFAAWFEPTHHTVEPTAPFFARRFADMDWMIVTPDVTARFEAGSLTFHPGQEKPELPEDATEALWATYFRNIFNPARVKIGAMTSEMPRKYWKNMPETRHIPDMLASAEARVRKMQEAAPSIPPLRAGRIQERLRETAGFSGMTFDELRRKAEEENRDVQPGYGRFVMGEGPEEAELMVVGEQPGDVEDQQGRPFVGPAGQLFDRVAEEAGLDRTQAYVTNAVKRFKFTQRGKRRLHQSPDGGDIQHARWWLASEIELVKPKLILAMGGTAAETLTGQRAGIMKRRGQIEKTEYGPIFLTVHPSFILRQRDESVKAAEAERFRADLAAVRHHLA